MRRSSWVTKLASVLAVVAGMVMFVSGAAAQPERTVHVVEVEGVVDPPMADYLRAQLGEAQRDPIHAVIIQLDTPGGLSTSMRDIIKDILDSEVPVIVWVAPRGAQAASAGTFITYAANLAYMAEATEIGAATPVNLGGESDEAMERKALNDAAAFIRELAETRGRNADWAEDAVREAASAGAREAAEKNVVDGVASSLRALLEQVDGSEVEVASGRETTLDTWDPSVPGPNVTIEFQNMNLLQQLLHVVTNPEIAFALLLIGTYGIIFELYNPGIGLAGILGAVALLLGFYALSVLPTNWAGVLLIALSVIFFIVDLQTAGLGVWTAGGVAALVVGGLLLFSGAAPEVTLSPWAIVAAVVGTLVFFVSVMTAALRVRLRRPVTGEEGIVGTYGTAKTDIAPEGTVLSKGTLWRARTTETGIAAGSRVRIKASEGLVLLVEPAPEAEDEGEERGRERSAAR